jgi:hypothetical protein
MNKETKEQLKTMFDVYDDCKERVENAEEYLAECESQDSDEWVEAQTEMETYWVRKDEVAEEIKTYVNENVSQQDLLEVIRENFNANR